MEEAAFLYIIYTFTDNYELITLYLRQFHIYVMIVPSPSVSLISNKKRASAGETLLFFKLLNGNPVPTALFGLVQRFVRLAEHGADVFRIFRRADDAAAGTGNGKLFSVHGDFPESFPGLPVFVLEILHGRKGNGNDEFIAGDSETVVIAEPGNEGIGKNLQHRVSRFMAVIIVKPLEMVNIQVAEKDFMARQGFEEIPESPPVFDMGEFIPSQSLFQKFVLLFQRLSRLLIHGPQKDDIQDDADGRDHDFLQVDRLESNEIMARGKEEAGIGHDQDGTDHAARETGDDQGYVQHQKENQVRIGNFKEINQGNCDQGQQGREKDPLAYIQFQVQKFLQSFTSRESIR